LLTEENSEFTFQDKLEISPSHLLKEGQRTNMNIRSVEKYANMPVSLQKGNQSKARGDREQRRGKTSNLQRVPLTDIMFTLLKMGKPIFACVLSVNESFNNKLSM